VTPIQIADVIWNVRASSFPFVDRQWLYCRFRGPIIFRKAEIVEYPDDKVLLNVTFVAQIAELAKSVFSAGHHFSRGAWPGSGFFRRGRSQ
jgi:hypothetical protein